MKIRQFISPLSGGKNVSIKFISIFTWLCLECELGKIKLCHSFHFSVFQHALDSQCGLAYLTPPSRHWSSPVGIPHALSCELWDNYPAGLALFPSVIIVCTGNKAARSLHSLRHPLLTTPHPTPPHRPPPLESQVGNSLPP